MELHTTFQKGAMAESTMAESESLEDRLRRHARVFDGLLALIPAKQYYSEDKSDQWQKRKQTKKEARAAKLAKLDPDNYKSALDVIQENERKRKREEQEEPDEPAEGSEKPREGMRIPKAGKKQRTASSSKELEKPANPTSTRQDKKEKKKKQAQDKKAKKEAGKAQKATTDQDRQTSESSDAGEDEEHTDDQAAGNNDIDLSFSEPADPMVGNEISRHDGDDQTEPTADIAPSEKSRPDNASVSSTSSKSRPSTETSSAQLSGTSSTSSTATAGSLASHQPADQKDRPRSNSQGSSIFSKSGTAPRLTMAEMQERLRQRIAEKRAERHADGDGRPAKTRAELIESRRKKQDQRKATKKALRQQAREEEIQKKEEAIARGSPLMSPTVHSPPNGEVSTNFSFGRIGFENGQMMTADLSATVDLSKRRGPSDVKAALAKANARDARLAGMDAEKRAREQEKNMWLNARKRAHGERKQKDKSANDWKKRTDGVKAAQEAKQKKREENLAKRKEEKGGKGSKSLKSKKPKKPKKRPGFEGSFRSGSRK